MEKRTDTKHIRRIAIVGPESTGKSTLAEQLAGHYNTAFAPEYAREYIGKLNRPYTLDDILIISKTQVELEDVMATKANNLLICDTNLLVTKIWAEHKYKQCPQWILDNIKKRHYDLYLLCDIDIPWQADTQREHPHLRKELFSIYKNELDKQSAPYAIINGLHETRLRNAIKAVDE